MTRVSFELCATDPGFFGQVHKCRTAGRARHTLKILYLRSNFQTPHNLSAARRTRMLVQWTTARVGGFIVLRFMSDKSDHHSTWDESGFDCGSPVEIADSAEDGRVSPRSRKCPACSQWTFSAIFTVEITDDWPSLPSDEIASNAAELFQHIFLECEEANQYLGRRFVKFMMVLFDTSSIHSPVSHEDECYQYQIPVRGYLECKQTTIHNLYGWMPEKLIWRVKWSAIPSLLSEHQPYLDDMSHVSDMRQPWGTLFRAGRNASPRCEGRVWVFTGQMICNIGDDADGTEKLRNLKIIFGPNICPMTLMRDSDRIRSKICWFFGMHWTWWNGAAAQPW